MKIAIIHSCFGIFGGAEYWIREVANKLVQRGHEVFIIAATVNSKQLKVNKEIKTISLSRYDVKHPLYFPMLPNIIRTGKVALQKVAPDIVNAHHFPSYIAAYLYNPQKTFWYAHEPYPLFHNPFFIKHSILTMKARSYSLSLMYKRLDIKYARKIPIVVSNSQFSQELFYRAHHRWPDEVIYPGYYIDPSHASNKPLQGKTDKRILVIGPSSAIKGFEYALKVYEVLAKKYDLELLVVGNVDPKYSRMLELYIKEKRPGYKGIKFDTRRYSPAELATVYASADLTLYCSINEPFGMVPVESLVVGTPCVGFYMGGLKESFFNEELRQFLAPPASINELINITKKIINSNYRISLKTRNLIKEKFSWERTVDQYEQLIKKIAESS
ncbi:MAG: glycosyltransferase family 4 protein [Promethearchaeota archaeon]